MLSTRDASRLRACPRFTPMPFRFTEAFGDWLTLSKLTIGKWEPGLFRSTSLSDVSASTSRWDRQDPPTPSVDGTSAEDVCAGNSSSSRTNLVRVGPRSPEGHELLINPRIRLRKSRLGVFVTAARRLRVVFRD